jgi:hypothetical protein
MPCNPSRIQGGSDNYADARDDWLVHPEGHELVHEDNREP